MKRTGLFSVLPTPLDYPQVWMVRTLVRLLSSAESTKDCKEGKEHTYRKYGDNRPCNGFGSGTCSVAVSVCSCVWTINCLFHFRIDEDTNDESNGYADKSHYVTDIDQFIISQLISYISKKTRFNSLRI